MRTGSAVVQLWLWWALWPHSFRTQREDQLEAGDTIMPMHMLIL
jgi:hypothetical protein